MFKKLLDKFSKKNLLKDIYISDSNIELFESLTQKLKEEFISEFDNSFSHYSKKLSETETYVLIKKLDKETKKNYVFWALQKVVSYDKYVYRYDGKSNSDPIKTDTYRLLKDMVLSSLFRGNLHFNTNEIIHLLHFFKVKTVKDYGFYAGWPVSLFLLQIEKKSKNEKFDENLKNEIANFLVNNDFIEQNRYFKTEEKKLRSRIEKILNPSDGLYKVFVFDKEDKLGDFGNELLSKQTEKDQRLLSEILEKANKVTTSKPSKKFLKDTSTLIDELGQENYKKFLKEILTFIVDLKIEEDNKLYHGEYYTHGIKYLDKENAKLIKGLVWSANKFHEKELFRLISNLSLKVLKKIPGIGPASLMIGNACLFYFGNTKGKNGVAQLSFLKSKVTQASIKKTIDKYIDGVSEKLGLSKEDIEESIVPDVGLILGSKEYEFEDYLLKINIERIGKVSSVWIKPDGNIQKTAPSFIKNKKTLTDKLAKAKADIKEINKYVSSQKNRLDSLFIVEKEITFENFHEYYLNHGLVSFLARKLIWIIKDNNSEKVGFFDGEKWIDSSSKEITKISKESSFQLWHPIYSKTEEIVKWREFLQEREIVQPLKQAFREIYILTDAEIKTKNYSNRMASHIIKQHQFNSLTTIRNWEYQLVGAWDHGSDCIARKKINNETYKVEYWLNEIFDSQNDVGMLSYMSTDQVRFIKDEQTLDLVDVPPIIFSECMRDVDLFVGVCSVGNDPEWADNEGNAQYRNYWTSYSFGNLSEVAKTRKGILETLIPRLKINTVASIEGNFLKIKGKLRNYKIHIGSSNILMEPNDQYLCIVSSRKKDVSEKVFLPFEGDNGLSLVLSKAFLLADDNKIKDPTITSQINRK